MERGQRPQKTFVLRRETNKTHKKDAGCIIFNHQDIQNGDTPIELYTLEKWCQIITEGDIHLLFSDGPLEEIVEATEMEQMSAEVVELKKLAVLGKDEVGLKMQIVLTDNEDDPSP